jgi:hypothetical protein
MLVAKKNPYRFHPADNAGSKVSIVTVHSPIVFLFRHRGGSIACYTWAVFTIEEVMENYLLLEVKKTDRYAYLEVLTMEPVERKLVASDYSFSGFDIWMRVLATNEEEGVKVQRRDGTEEWDSYFTGEELKWTFHPKQPALKTPWAAPSDFDPCVWLLRHPDEMPWCPKCDEGVTQFPDYLCADCRYGPIGLELP